MTYVSNYCVDDVIENNQSEDMMELEAPSYRYSFGYRLALSCPSMMHHTSDEGWQVFLALRSNSYLLVGSSDDCDISSINVLELLLKYDPAVIVMQDHREWASSNPLHLPNEVYKNWECLKNYDSCFKVTILKDAHQRPWYHRRCAEDMGCNAWIVYYHPKIVKHLAKYVRSQHLIRTYHSIDSLKVPEFTDRGRNGVILSGAISFHYPLRTKLFYHLPSDVFRLRHPGYVNNYCYTYDFMNMLSRFKVSICTASKYGYALRKIFESVACGCVVVTDLPSDDVLPEIDECLVRISPSTSVNEVYEICKELEDNYDADKCKYYADKCKRYYDYRHIGRLLAYDIDRLMRTYSS
ncbi:MAG: hypothetical protein QXQ02_01045 [Halobacteria archaeon]